MVWSITVEFSPGTSPFDSPSWVDISDRVMSLSWTVGTQQELSDYPPGEATVVLDNSDRLFDPDNTTGTYYGDLLPRVPFRIRCEVADPILDNGEYVVDDTGQVVVDNTTTTYDLFYGFVEDGWEQGYEPPDTATCTVKLIDLLAVLEGYTLPSVLEASILADGPHAYWALAENASRTIADSGPNGFDGRADHGTTGLATTVESESGAVIDGIEFDAEHRVYVADMASVVAAAPVTVEAVVLPLGDKYPGSSGVFFRSGTGNPNDGLTMQVAGTGAFSAGIRATTNGIAAAFNTNLNDGFPHHVAYKLPAAGTASVWVDGENVTDSTGTLSDGVVAVPGTMLAGVKTYVDGKFGGFVADVAVYAAELSDATIAEHAQAALAPLAGLRSDEQIEWILDQIGVPAGMRDLDTGRSLMGPLNSKGRNALELLREIAATEQGALFVDHAVGGKIRFCERYHSWMNPRAVSPQAVFTDDPSVTLNRVEPDTLAMDSNGVRSIINRVTVSWIGGEETVEDTASSAAYGPRGISLSTASRTAAVARGVGHWITLQNAQPKTRVRGFDLDVGGDPAGVYPACSLRIGDRVEFAHKPQNSGNRTIRQLELLGASHQVDGVWWRTSFYLRDSPSDSLTLFTLDVSELDGPDILAY